MSWLDPENDPLAECDRWPSIPAFYAADRRRERSPEVDFGIQWRVHGQGWPLWRVSFIKDTGEVYAVALGPVNTVLLLGTFPVTGFDADVYYRDLDEHLAGWPTHHDVEWVQYMLTEHPRASLPGADVG